MTVLATIGYEGSSLQDFVATLKAAQVRRLLDVRELPISRRPGFAKRALSAAMDEAGIEYVHLKGLGDPKEGREAARRSDFDEFHRVFTSHMATEAAQLDLVRAAAYVVDGGACLMCYERNHTQCHRKLVADAISAKMTVSVRHIGVRDGIAKTAGKCEP